MSLLLFFFFFLIPQVVIKLLPNCTPQLHQMTPSPPPPVMFQIYCPYVTQLNWMLILAVSEYFFHTMNIA